MIVLLYCLSNFIWVTLLTFCIGAVLSVLIRGRFVNAIVKKTDEEPSKVLEKYDGATFIIVALVALAIGVFTTYYLLLLLKGYV
jgi:uncharacterized membrane protein